MEREVILLGDQALPPLLPSSSELNCMRIIRLEFGSLHTLVTILLEMMEGRRLCPGSLILLFSVSHITHVGIAGYIEDMVAAKKRIQAKLGENINVSAAPPLLLCGLDREESIRDISELQGWMAAASQEELHFKAANEEALCAIMENGYGGSQPEYRQRVRLPADMSGRLAQKIWCTGGSSSLPCATSPTNETQEKLVMEALITDIKGKLAIDLNESLDTSRKIGTATEKGLDNFLVVGSSNARRLVAALAAKGVPVGSVLSNSWRATKQPVHDMAEQVRRELENGNYTAVIFQLLDNNMYFAGTEEGGLIPATRDQDGRYHVEGDLVLADRSAQLAVLKLCSPIWDTAAGKHMVVVSPLPRYVRDGCCDAQEHMPNRKDPEFYTTLKQELAACAKNIKDFLFNSGMRNGRVMDPQKNLRGLSVADIWREDPIHPKEEVYAELAVGVIDVEKSCGNGRDKRKARDHSWDSGMASRGGRMVRGWADGSGQGMDSGGRRGGSSRSTWGRRESGSDSGTRGSYAGGGSTGGGRYGGGGPGGRAGWYSRWGW